MNGTEQERGEDQIQERRRERRGKADRGGMGTGTAEGEAGANGEDRGGRGEKCFFWSRMCRSTGRSTRGTVPIRFGTYNIRNGCNGGLESASRGMSQANMDLVIFQETKVTYGIYTRGSAGYSVDGRGAVFHRPALNFVVEAVQQFGPNVVDFQLATGARWWYIVGCYLAPDDTSKIESVVAALK